MAAGALVEMLVEIGGAMVEVLADALAHRKPKPKPPRRRPPERGDQTRGAGDDTG